MALSSGTSLGPYEIESPLGAGGMGEVYKARDTRLDRTVAIKVLPEHVAVDADLKQRFEREAKTVAGLSHPHICSVFDVGSQDGIDYLVMEYLDGETLAQRLEKGALPLGQALQIAIEIADALDKAHRQGIVHRDLKPGNIMLTKGGAKLLDFGLAKLGPAALSSVTSLTTRSTPLTEQGMLLGTLPYMAPEQVQGRDTDARSDLFSFGAILYEMLVGQRPFAGDNQASLIARILEVDPPPLSSLKPVTPPALERVVMACLAKDPDRRWQTATDLERQLVWVREGLADKADPDHNVPWVKRRPVVWSAGVGMAIGAILTWVVLPRPQVATPATVTRATIELPRGQTLNFLGRSDPLAISPDGARLAYVASGDEGVQLYVRELDALEALALPETQGARYPFFSPDGEHVAFFADDKLQRVALAGGAPVPICDVVGVVGRAGTWSVDGTIVFAPEVGLMRVDASGGQPERIVSNNPEIDGQPHRYPRFLPDGRGVLSTVRLLEGFEPEAVAILDLQTSEWHVISVGVQGQYLPTGHVVFHGGSGEEGELHAVPFDLDTMSARGARVSGRTSDRLRQAAPPARIPSRPVGQARGPATRGRGARGRLDGGDSVQGVCQWSVPSSEPHVVSTVVGTTRYPPCLWDANRLRNDIWSRDLFRPRGSGSKQEPASTRTLVGRERDLTTTELANVAEGLELSEQPGIMRFGKGSKCASVVHPPDLESDRDV